MMPILAYLISLLLTAGALRALEYAGQTGPVVTGLQPRDHHWAGAGRRRPPRAALAESGGRRPPSNRHGAGAPRQ